MSWANVAGAAVGVVGGALLSKGGSGGGFDKSAGAAQAQLAQISAEEWDLYQKEAVPLLKELVGMRTPTTVEQEQALAAGEVKGAYGQARQQLERAIGTVRNPGDQGTAALLAPTYMDEAGAVSRALTDARRMVDDRTWARTIQAIGSYQRLPQDASAAAARSGELGLGSSALALRGQQQGFNQAAETAYGATAIANAARKWFQQPSRQQAIGSPSDATYNTGGVYPDFGYEYYSSGVQNPDYTYGYKAGGKVKGPGTGTSDSVPALVDGRKPVQLSNGEYVIPADVVRAKGQEFFDKLLQRYHRPAPERERGMANGGAIQKRGLPAEVEDAIFVSLPREALSRRGR